MKTVLIILFIAWLLISIVALATDIGSDKQHKTMYQEHIEILDMKVNLLLIKYNRLSEEMEKIKNDSRLS